VRWDTPERRSEMATLGELVADAAEEVGDDVKRMVCFYQPITGERYTEDHLGAPVRCEFRDLPDREFDDGYGAVDGNPFIGFTDRYVYVHRCYDGAEAIVAVPRHPEYVGDEIPLVGGG
jgi:hypothetical protein